MKKLLMAVAMVAALPTAAMAQDEATAPDGSPAYGVEPYVGVLGGYHTFDRNSEFGSPLGGRMNGGLVSGVAGVNVPLGPVFVGAEGNITKGFNDIDWEYGVKGRIGGRAGKSGMVYVSAGYQWIEAKGPYADNKDWIYGVGVEVGPKDLGMNSSSNLRLRISAETYDFNSIRPMAGIIASF